MGAFVTALLGNLWLAGAVAVLAGVLGLKVPPFAILSGAVVALLALRRGVAVGLSVAVIAAIPVGAAWVWLGTRPGLVFPLALALWPPLLAAAEVLRRTGAQGLALLVIGLTVAGYDLAMHLAVDDVVAFWHDWLRQAIAAVPGARLQGFEEEDMIRLMNGFLGFLYGLSLAVALLFGRWLQSLACNPGGFAPEFRRLRLPRVLLPVAVAALWAAGWFDPLLAAEWFMAAMLVYFFVGLAVIHGVIAVRGMAPGWTVPAYVTLVYLPSIAIPGLALLGALDAFVDFRAQKQAAP